MSSVHRHKGFSLTEVLLAIGTLAIGMSFVGGTFLVGVHLSAIATERTIAATAADEAFAKVQLYGIDFSSPDLSVDKQVLFSTLNPIPIDEYAYPSAKITSEKQYYWAALCRPVSSNAENRIIQVTAFISRRVGRGSAIPVPVEVPVTGVTGEDKLIVDSAAQQSLINAGSKIVSNLTGKLYRVVERDAVSQNTITLDVPWQGGASDSVWVIPPIATGKSPCVAVYQKEIRF